MADQQQPQPQPQDDDARNRLVDQDASAFGFGAETMKKAGEDKRTLEEKLADIEAGKYANPPEGTK